MQQPHNTSVAAVEKAPQSPPGAALKAPNSGISSASTAVEPFLGDGVSFLVAEALELFNFSGPLAGR
jgi:hypothetical protein